MDQKTFELVLSNKIQQIMDILQDTEGMLATDARLYLYSSKLYALLEREETKVWHYSAHQLVVMLYEEKETGEIGW